MSNKTTKPKTPDDQLIIHQLSDRIILLKDRLRESLSNLNSIKMLINRNKNQPIPEEKLEFPFLVLSTLDSESNTVSMRSNQDRSSVSMSFSAKFTWFGEVEALRKLDGITQIQNVKTLQTRLVSKNIYQNNKNPLKIHIIN